MDNPIFYNNLQKVLSILICEPKESIPKFDGYDYHVEFQKWAIQNLHCTATFIEGSGHMVVGPAIVMLSHSKFGRYKTKKIGVEFPRFTFGLVPFKHPELIYSRGNTHGIVANEDSEHEWLEKFLDDMSIMGYIKLCPINFIPSIVNGEYGPTIKEKPFYIN